MEQESDGMNHDITHCADYTESCPKDCFRAQRTEKALEKHWTMIRWAHFKGSEPPSKCREYAKQKGSEVTE